LAEECTEYGAWHGIAGVVLEKKTGFRKLVHEDGRGKLRQT